MIRGIRHLLTRNVHVSFKHLNQFKVRFNKEPLTAKLPGIIVNIGSKKKGHEEVDNN